MSQRTPATDKEQEAIRQIKRVRFAPSWDSAFVRQLADKELTDKERPQLWRMVLKYRRQIGYMMRADNGATWKAEILNLMGEAAMNSRK